MMSRREWLLAIVIGVFLANGVALAILWGRQTDIVKRIDRNYAVMADIDRTLVAIEADNAARVGAAIAIARVDSILALVREIEERQ
jgi:hypothetical protein